MYRKTLSVFFIFLTGVFAFASLAWNAEIQVITLHGKPLTLIGKKSELGKSLPALSLPDLGMEMIDLQSFKGKVTIMSVVPSLDTPTCEKQTHILSEENGGLDKTVNLVTVSRDLPFAQKRFAKNAKINNIIFLSDYRNAEFGKKTGLLIKENFLLARAVFVLDQKGIVRYLEIVSELAKLPDMDKAMDFARSL
ncbi:MAG: lipid hydroperoxide peroxidase [Nitrospina sp.]|nr:lipid hydroperoxide peroxidase [Nitrospina sp.]|tara:strand:+ start:421 stop:1002 length:582 start_codon:yes stop_codon:yes gene_type:complete